MGLILVETLRVLQGLKEKIEINGVAWYLAYSK